MRRNKKHFGQTIYGVLLLLFLAFVAMSTTPVFAKANPRYASIVMDADTGLILHQSRADKILHPASLTKAMTLMLVFEALENGQISLRERVHISRRAASMIPSKLNLPVGSSIRVEDAIHALVTKSANDVAVALAEHLSGSEYQFARLMTRKARSIGMNRTIFKNASGLHHKGQISTARDMAKMGRVLIRDYPEYYKYFSKKTFTYRGKTYRNHNRLMDTYKGMDGLKTGYIQASGFNLVASAVRNDRRIIGVVFGGRTSKSRNAHMKKLLDRGFAKLGDMRIATAKVPVPERKPPVAYAVAALNKIAPATGLLANPSLSSPQYKWAQFSKLIGEGDSDPAASERIETGLMAIRAHTDGQFGRKFERVYATPLKSALGKSYTGQRKLVSYTPPFSTDRDNWAIQVGAFTSRAQTDKTLHRSIRELPERYRARPSIAPLKTAKGWLFRGRLSGYSKKEATRACAYLNDCLLIAPPN